MSYRAKINDVMEARVVQEPAPVQVAENADVVGAVREQRVKFPFVCQLDSLKAASGLDAHLVMLAQQIQAEGVRRTKEAQAGRLEDISGLEEPGSRCILREFESRVQEGNIEAHTVEGTERLRLVEGLYKLLPQLFLVLRLVRTHACKLVRALLARVVVLRADNGDNAARRVQPRCLDVKDEHLLLQPKLRWRIKLLIFFWGFSEREGI